MNERSLTEILAMSGYASYVWTAFGLVLLTLIVLFIISRGRLKKALKMNQQLLAERKR